MRLAVVARWVGLTICDWCSYAQLGLVCCRSPPRTCALGCILSPLRGWFQWGWIMFERYTGKARRVIFFARYEASRYGSPYIETEHLLLGLLHQDKSLAARLLPSGSRSSQYRRKLTST